MRLPMTIYVKKFLIVFSFIISTTILSGCLSPVKSRSDTAYMLNAIPHVSNYRKHSQTILVAFPTTAPAFNTTQMAYTLYPYHLAYFSQNRWAETPAQMLQPLIVKTLQNSHYFHAIVTPPFVGRYDYVLTTQILQLQQDYTYPRAMLKLTVRAQLSSMAANRVIATKDFSILEPMHQYTPYGGVLAANRATSRLLTQLTEFVTSRLIYS